MTCWLHTRTPPCSSSTASQDSRPIGDEEMKVKVRVGPGASTCPRRWTPPRRTARTSGSSSSVRQSAPASRRRSWTGVVAEGGLREWAPRRRSATSRRTVRSTPSARGGYPWIEIDFPGGLPARGARDSAGDRRGAAVAGRPRQAAGLVMLAHSAPPSRSRPKTDPQSGPAAARRGASAAARACRTSCAACARCCSPTARSDATRDRLVAVVATSDDGGSSGRLRAEFNMIPPGDIRNCLAALSGNESRIADIFQYRFDAGDGLNGHAIGNLVLAALADVTQDFAEAVEIAARILGISRHRAAGDVRDRHARRGVRGRTRAERRDDDRDRPAARSTGSALLPERPRCSHEGQRRAAPRRRDRRRARAASIRASCRRCWCPISRTRSWSRARSGSSSRT